MPTTVVNGVELYWELNGEKGDPLVLVHGSWGDHHTWEFIVPLLERSFRVLTYDRRGHSQSEQPSGQGSIREDVSDLESLIEHLYLVPAHILGNSFGGSIVLRLANERPELFRSILIHEPPLFGVVEDPTAEKPLKDTLEHIGAVIEKLEVGQMEIGSRLFMETVAIGPGAWEEFPEEVRQRIILNASTYLDEIRDPEWPQVDLKKLDNLSVPTLLTKGDESPPSLLFIADKLEQALPQAQTQTLKGAGHIPQSTHPEEYVEAVKAFIRQSASGSI
jgi:pimeloyl-ACP methyl ester carboxylesterase